MNFPDSKGNTPLHFAAAGFSGFEKYQAEMRREREECVELLLKAGANVHAKNNLAQTPSDMIRAKDLEDEKRALLKILKSAERSLRLEQVSSEDMSDESSEHKRKKQKIG